MTSSEVAGAGEGRVRAPSLAVRRYVSTVNAISRGFGAVSAVLLGVSMLVICQMVTLRYVFRAPTIWQTDFAVFTATAAIFLGAPYVLLAKGHVGVDVVEAVVGPRTRRRLRIGGSLLGLLFCLGMLVASAMFVHEAWSEEWRTSGVWQIPLALPTLPLPIGFGLLCLQYLAEILQPEGGHAP